jgi:dipeptidyl aminopeptidase/acylaminoacyl peptidase
MNVLRWLAVVAAACIAAPCAAAPLEAYGKLPTIEDVAISADGQKLAVLATNGEERRIAIRNLADGSTRLVGVGPIKARGLYWAGSDHLLIEKSSTANILELIGPTWEYFQLFDYNLTDNRINPLMADAGQSLNVVVGPPPKVRTIGGRLAVVVEGVHFVNNRGQDSLFRIDLQSGRSDIIDPGFTRTDDWVAGPDGKPLAEAEYDQQTGLWSLKLKVPGGWREVKSMTAPVEHPRLLGLGRDGASILVADPQDGNPVLREIPLANPTWAEPFRTAAETGLIHDPMTGRLIGYVRLAGDDETYEFLNPGDAAAWAKIVRAYKGYSVSLASWSDDRSRIVVRVDSPTEGPSYALVDLKANRSDPLGHLYEGVAAADIAPVRALRFKAKDGLDLSGYLTLPRGREAKGLPLAVLVHGGPAARDEPGFDWWSQALASRGYAVLRVNYRGSRGFGAKHLAAGYGEWGRKMQTDVSDGVRYLAAEGTIDPKRVCIVGGSYGGYAALAGAAFDPGVYRCAASLAGPADLKRMVIRSRDDEGSLAKRYWVRFMGAKGADDPVLDQISPALHADKITIPILLIHGKDDIVVPIEQTYIMERALKAAGKPVETVIMPGEDHWLSRGATRLKMLQSMVAFLEKNNPPQ